MKNYLIKKATIKDLEKIHRIEKEVQIEPWSKISILSFLKAGQHIYFWCLFHKKNKRLLGYICFQLIFDELYILNISISKKWQNKGFGSIILGYLYQYAQIKDIKRIVLDVHKINQCAISFYIKCGFKFANDPKVFKGTHYIMVMSLSHN